MSVPRPNIEAIQAYHRKLPARLQMRDLLALADYALEQERNVTEHKTAMQQLHTALLMAKERVAELEAALRVTAKELIKESTDSYNYKEGGDYGPDLSEANISNEIQRAIASAALSDQPSGEEQK